MNEIIKKTVSEVQVLLHMNNFKTNCWFQDINITETFNYTECDKNGYVLGVLYFQSKPDYRNIKSNNFFDYLLDISKVYNPKTIVLFDSYHIRKLSLKNNLDFKSYLFYIILHEYCHYQDLHSRFSLQYLDYDTYCDEIERRTNDMALNCFMQTKYFNNNLVDYLNVA